MGASRRSLPPNDRARERQGAGGKARFDPEDFAEDWVRRHRWRLRIPGTHYGGLSNQALLDVRESEGRPFDRRTRAQAEHVIERIADAFESRTTKPGESQVRREGNAALKEWLLMRVERGGFDVPLRQLSPKYAAWKARKYPGRPIGVARGRWIGAVEKRGFYEFE